jgi:hypothetical protein
MTQDQIIFELHATKNENRRQAEGRMDKGKSKCGGHKKNLSTWHTPKFAYITLFFLIIIHVSSISIHVS